MQQGHAVLAEGLAHLSEDHLLDLGERVQRLGLHHLPLPCLDTAHGLLHYLAQALLHQHIEYLGRCSGGTKQVILRHQVGLALLQRVTAVQQRHIELLLAGRTFQLVEGLRQIIAHHYLYERAHLGLEIDPDHSLLALFGLQFGGQGSLHHIADGAHIVIGDPLPQLQLHGTHYRPLVEQFDHILDLYSLGALIGQCKHDAGIDVVLAQWCRHAHPHLHTLRHTVRQTVGEGAFERHGQYQFGILGHSI